MTRRPEFPPKVKLAAFRRAGGPDDPRCECFMVPGFRETCGRQPITYADPVEYHHIYEAEMGDEVDPEFRDWLKSIENCAVVRRSCHKLITGQVTMPKVVKSRNQRKGHAKAKAKGRGFETNKDGRYKAKIGGGVEKR